MIPYILRPSFFCEIWALCVVWITYDHLGNNFFQFLDKTFKRKHPTTIATKFNPPYSILLIADLEKRLLSDIDFMPYIWIYIGDIFLIWGHGKKSLKLSLGGINTIHPTIKLMVDWSSSSPHFLDVKVILKDGKIIKSLYVKLTDTHEYLASS